jgi:hypothetical protein
VRRRTVATKILSIADFFTDAAAGTLPNYCLVEPDYGHQSEENPQNIAVGEEFAASVVNAVINAATRASTSPMRHAPLPKIG